MRRMAVLALVALALSNFAAITQAETTRWSDHDWNRVWQPGQPVEDGMLMPGRLLMSFEGDSVPNLVRAKAGNGVIETEQLALNEVAERFNIRSLERVFPETRAERAKAGAPDQRARNYVLTYDDASASLRDVAEAIDGLPGVEWVEPDVLHFMHSNLPNDPSLPQQYWLRNTSPGGADIRALPAWYHTTGSSDIIVCVADSGLDYMHPDLGGAASPWSDGVVWTNSVELAGGPGDSDGNGYVDDFRGWDFVTNVSSPINDPPQDLQTPDNDPMDYESHGTWVAGCISAITNNGQGIASTNWSAKVMGCRIGWYTEVSDGQGGTFESGVVLMSFAAQAFDYARVNGADVYNASWGSSGLLTLINAVNNAVNAGMLIVTSAGNSNDESASYLASRGDVVSVAATNSTDNKAGFSSYGSWVDISAPGVAIFTTEYNRFNGTHTYGAPDGTSFSAPIVAGALALIRSAFPGLNRQQCINKLLAAVDDISEQNPVLWPKLGSGRLNLAKLWDIPSMWLIPDQLPTLLDAMNYSDPGDTVAVLAGAVIEERFIMQEKDVQILAGWDPTYTTRDPVSGKATIEVLTGTGPVLQALSGVGPELVMDGFIVRGGKANQVSFEPVDGRYGGGLFMRDASPTLRNMIFEDNIAGTANEFGAGAGAAILRGSPVFENCEFRNNTALRGPAIYVYQASPTFTNTSIHDNTTYGPSIAGDPLGGAVYVLDAEPAKLGGPVVFDGGDITGHSVTGPGGGIYAENSDISVSNMTIDSNAATAEGSGIRVVGGSYTGGGNTFVNNVTTPGALVNGGGLSVQNAATSIDGSTFDQNSAAFGGGGAHFATVSSLSVQNSFFLGNGSGIFGSAVYIDTPPASSNFTGNTVASNVGGSAGAAGVYATGGSLEVSQNIFAFNGGGGTSIADGLAGAGTTLTFSCNLAFSNDAGNYGGVTEDPTGTNGNISADPLFCSVVAGDYNLMSGSPADAGCGLMGAGTVGCGAVGIDDGPVSARQFDLEQNWPNPFNPATTIAFSLPRETQVRLKVYDLRGRHVRLLRDSVLEAGRHTFDWNGRDDSGRSVASGTYFYELTTDAGRIVRKMGLLK